MNSWAGIKPRSANYNKTLAPKPIQRNKMSKQHYHQTTKQNSLEEEVAKAVQDLRQTSTQKSLGEEADLHQTSAQKSLEEEVASAVQNLLALNKADQSNGSANEKVSEGLIPSQDSSGQSNQDMSNFKTPENETPDITTDMVRGKKMKKPNCFKRPSRINNLGTSFYENAESMEVDDVLQLLTPKRPKFDQDLINEIGGQVSGDKCSTASNISKYLKVEGQEGRILSAYYTVGQDEKLKEFVPMFVNIGNRFQAKELIGIRKNTKFVSTNSKSRMKSPEEQANYLVISFENRKKTNSPFIEYPLNRLDMVIQALQELKETAIKLGHYKEQTILNCRYPQNTKICPGDDKNTVLKINGE